MATDDISLSDAANVVLTAEHDALQEIFDKAKAFRDDMNAVIGRLTFPPGYISQPKQIAQGMVAGLAFQVDNQLPQLLASFQS